MMALAVSSVFAQSVPDAGSLQNQMQSKDKRLPDRLPEAEPPPARPIVKKAPGIKVMINQVRFSGATHLAPESELQGVVAAAIKQELDFAELEQLAARVTDLLRSHGWLLSRAYLPEQELTDGVLEIGLLEGTYDGYPDQGKPYAIEADRNQSPRIDFTRLEAIAARHLKPGAVAREDELERVLLLMNDMPGVSARASLEPGSRPNSARVAITASEGPLLSGTASLDNYGSADIGRTQANATARLNDALGIGDQLSLSGTHAQGLDLAAVAYSLPLGSDGVRAQAAASALRYKVIEGTGRAAELEGRSNTLGVLLSYPWIRTRAHNLYSTVGYTARSLSDDSGAGNLRDKRIDNWNVAVSGDMLDKLGGGGMTSAHLNWTKGRVDLSRNAGDAAADSMGYQVQGGFNKLGYGMSRLQRLSGSFALLTAFSGQATRDNLDTSEKFILGGPYGVRAYSGAEAMGDSGWLANLELRYDLPGTTRWGKLQFTAFADTGHIKLHSDPKGIPLATATSRNSYSLSGWGVGMNLTQADRYVVRVGWAGKLGDNPGRSAAGLDADNRKDRSRVWLQAAIAF